MQQDIVKVFSLYWLTLYQLIPNFSSTFNIGRNLFTQLATFWSTWHFDQFILFHSKLYHFDQFDILSLLHLTIFALNFYILFNFKICSQVSTLTYFTFCTDISIQFISIYRLLITQFYRLIFFYSKMIKRSSWRYALKFQHFDGKLIILIDFPFFIQILMFWTIWHFNSHFNTFKVKRSMCIYKA